MADDSLLRTDILSSDLTTSQEKVRVVSETQFNIIVANAQTLERSRTPAPSKNIIEVMDLIDQALNDYYRRTHVTEDAKVHITYESPDKLTDLEAVVFSLERREPGAFAQGAPWEGKVKNLRPLLREVIDDPDNPGYKRAILGYFHDNTLRLTCWARTNKAANSRALWLEEVMEEYTWFFRISGVNRILYEGRGAELVREVNGNRIYGRPIDYYVRTEHLKAISQKELEEIYVRLAIERV